MNTIIFPLLKGASLGLIIAIPSTSQTVLCIQETLKKGFKYGLISGLGVAVADTLFSLAAGFGIQAVSDWIKSYDRIMHISGASLILLFGIVLFVSKSEIETNTAPSADSRWKVVNAFMPNFLLTTLHPITLLFFSAAFAAMPLADSSVHVTTISLIAAGVFLGSMIWWVMVTWSVTQFIKDRMTTELLTRIKKFLGSIMGLMGFGLLVKHIFFIS